MRFFIFDLEPFAYKALTLVQMTANVSIFASYLMSQATDIIIQTGAGEEIRTLDPNLGKVMLYP